jgi:hypothetical protein
MQNARVRAMDGEESNMGILYRGFEVIQPHRANGSPGQLKAAYLVKSLAIQASSRQLQ